jgi:hypothetical protein
VEEKSLAVNFWLPAHAGCTARAAGLAFKTSKPETVKQGKTSDIGKFKPTLTPGLDATGDCQMTIPE